ncbi:MULTISPECIES: MFS transporter [unclassified Rhodococcus (in: high G+C Gram-positive bacteria)]|uniref:MFS transporter n=1 Tax=unclassified Rhodococcus (in: high G+C Gram-positive bacteria) TaxID=192944 RepID=UPI001FF79168|nr:MULTISPECIES: MFS transporter [unclassified Rhodococcus (in: high G+C Gram-positive bacteria)]
MTTSRMAEFRDGWSTLTAAAIGVGTGVTGLAVYSTGLFAGDLGREIGLTPGDYGLSITLLSLGMVLAAPVVGFVVDRVGVKVPTIAGALFLALTFVSLGTIVHSVPTYMAAMASMGFFGAGSGPIAFSRAVSSWFDRSRGLALGITMMGGGLAGTIIPITIGKVIELYGWQRGYLTLACIALVGVATSLLFLRTRSRSTEGLASGAVDQPALTGRDFSSIRRDPLYWRLILTFALLAMTVTGLVAYLIPMLRHYGMGAGQAATMASLMGLAGVIGRLGVGWLIDILRPTAVAAGLLLIFTASVVLFAVGGVGYAPVLAIALGCLLGGELDMVAYFTSRYFGLAAYGKAFAGPYMAFVLGGAIAPFGVGLVVDRTGTYTVALYGIAALAVVSAITFMFMPSPRGPRAFDSPENAILRPVLPAHN